MDNDYFPPYNGLVFTMDGVWYCQVGNEFLNTRESDQFQSLNC